MIKLATGTLVVLLLSACSSSDDRGADTGNLPADLSDSGAGQDDGGIEVGEPTELCPNGTISGGNGCFLPCEDGWWQGADGRCHIDCPAMSAPGAESGCTEVKCPEGWHPGPAGMIPCLPDCPPGFEIGEPNGAGPSCRLTCPAGMSRGSDGWCHLDCAEGMELDENSPTGCRLLEVGEALECPADKWPELSNPTNPVYIDSESQAANPDGTKENPFPTIAQAVEHAGTVFGADGKVTFVVAPGDYVEGVLIEGFKEVTLAGACAATTFVLGQGLGTTADGWGLGAVSIIDAEKVSVSGLAVTSDRKGVLVLLRKGSGTLAEISNIRVLESQSTGLQVAGLFDQVKIHHNSVEHARTYGITAAEDKAIGSISPSNIEIRNNEILHMEPCSGQAFCAQALYSVGIMATYGADTIIDANHVSDFEQAEGIFAAWSTHLTISRNLIDGLTGYLGISADGTNALIEDNRIADGKAGTFQGSEPTAFHGVMASPVMSYDPMALTFRRNFFRGIQGTALISSSPSAFGTEVAVSVETCEFTKSAGGIYVSSAAPFELLSSRFSDLRISLYQAKSTELLIEGNEMRDGVTGDGGMPAGVDRTLIMEMSTQVDLGFLQPSGNLLFKGNHLTGLPNLGTGAFFGTAVTISAVGGFTVEDNVFEKNDSGSLLSVASYSSAAIRGNHFRGPDPTTEGSGGAHTALTLGAEDDSKPTTVVVADNLFKDFMHNQYGPTVVMMYQHDDFDCRFTGNLFWAARMVRIFPGAGAVAKRLEFSDNELWGTILTVGAADELIIDSNQLSGFLLAVQGQPMGAAATIANNLLNAGIVEIQNPQGSLAITRNEISKAYGVGLAVASAGGSTPGPAGEPPGVTIQRNLFNNTTEDTWASGPVGKIGDGLQVTGTAEHPCSSVRILGNRFQDCARSGAIVSSATATVEGNMFPTGCPLVVQNEVTAGAVSGADSLFAEHPETPLGVVTLDYMSYME